MITHSPTPPGGRLFTLRKSAVHSLSPLRSKLDSQLLAASGDAAMGRSARALLAGRRGGLGRSARSAIAGAVSPPFDWPWSARLVALHLQGSARVWGSHLISATSTATASSYAPRTPRAPTPTCAKGRVCAPPRARPLNVARGAIAPPIALCVERFCAESRIRRMNRRMNRRA